MIKYYSDELRYYLDLAGNAMSLFIICNVMYISDECPQRPAILHTCIRSIVRITWVFKSSYKLYLMATIITPQTAPSLK